MCMRVPQVAKMVGEYTQCYYKYGQCVFLQIWRVCVTTKVVGACSTKMASVSYPRTE
eukprot:m.284707 g.284707  ORF g.284707 m.284707 type:complete len:57 (+) comp177208_c0_seq1:78-248(+)